MKAYHVHIEGQVQGVGFRPFVYRLANEMNLGGWVSNGTDGVHIEVEGEDRAAKMFLQAVVRNAPPSARITRHVAFEMPVRSHSGFFIKKSKEEGVPSLLVTPDLALCDDCKEEIIDAKNRRYQYAFTTCTNCGPRYSIMTAVPYDRAQTSMRPFGMCEKCYEEYETPTNRRFYSQTNSCPTCAVTVSLCEKSGKVITQETPELVSRTVQFLQNGKTIAIKAIGGYLLLCDARNEKAIEALRTRKHRPTKPLAILYPSIESVRADAFVSSEEEKALMSAVAPIVLLTARPNAGVASQAVAPQLNEIGVMLPSTPLLYLIAHAFGSPLVATSGNESGSPIFYEDEKAFEYLGNIADYFITNNRQIVVPQDDSVVRFTKEDSKIVLRRSRGMAPTFLPHPFRSDASWLAMGGDLKSAFALLHQQNVYASQYLGDLENFETQQSFAHTLNHWQALLKTQPQQII
ncbi:MAG: carbamoyltransferase HypF, partial [Flammeovirgaceae bacterium]